jgi:hypothetical protein
MSIVLSGTAGATTGNGARWSLPHWRRVFPARRPIHIIRVSILG